MNAPVKRLNACTSSAGTRRTRAAVDVPIKSVWHTVGEAEETVASHWVVAVGAIGSLY